MVFFNHLLYPAAELVICVVVGIESRQQSGGTTRAHCQGDIKTTDSMTGFKRNDSYPHMIGDYVCVQLKEQAQEQI